MVEEVSEGDGAARRDIGIVLGVVVVLALPHLVLGPDITADDWVWIRNGEFLGWWDAGGTRQVGRPGAFVLYALTFGAMGAHPLLHALVQVVLWAVAAVAVLVALREVVAPRLALVVTLVWLVAPSHTTLEFWASTSQAWVAVACLGFGSRAVARWARGERPLWPALVLLGAAGAFYEVAIIAAPICALAVDRRVTGRWRWTAVVPVGIACAPALVWSQVSATVYNDEVLTTEGYLLEHLAGPLSMGLDLDNRRQAAAVVLLAVVIGGARVARKVRGVTPTDIGLVVTGAALVLAGSLPALRSYSLPFGMGNRLTAVSGIGAAFFWVGALRPIVSRLPRPAVAMTGIALVALALAPRVDHLSQWHDVGDEAAEEATQLAAELDAAGNTVLVIQGPIAREQSFYGLDDGWNTTAAVQVVAADSDVVVQVDVGCIRSGPLASEPLEQYGQRAEQRVPGCE